MKVHVVEDEHALLMASQLALEHAKHKVTTSSNGNDACAEILAANPDVVCMDMLLPGKNGMEVIKEIRANGYKNAIVIFTNSDPKEISNHDLESLDISNVLIKSNIDLHELLTAVEAAHQEKSS